MGRIKKTNQGPKISRDWQCWKPLSSLRQRDKEEMEVPEPMRAEDGEGATRWESWKGWTICCLSDTLVLSPWTKSTCSQSAKGPKDWVHRGHCPRTEKRKNQLEKLGLASQEGVWHLRKLKLGQVYLLKFYRKCNSNPMMHWVSQWP